MVEPVTTFTCKLFGRPVSLRERSFKAISKPGKSGPAVFAFSEPHARRRDCLVF
jgi:hypothetical protein